MNINNGIKQKRTEEGDKNAIMVKHATKETDRQLPNNAKTYLLTKIQHTLQIQIYYKIPNPEVTQKTHGALVQSDSYGDIMWYKLTSDPVTFDLENHVSRKNRKRKER